jgi:plastocyanin
MNSSRSKHPTQRPVALLTLAIVLASVAVAGCGGSSSTTTASTTPASAPAGGSAASSSSAPAGQKLSLEANPEGQLKYTTSSLTAKAGTVTIDFTNASPLAHNLTIESPTGAKLGATPTFQGGSKTLTVDLKPGTYKFFCTVPGHRMAGMQGTLTVQ